jgi:acyl carrier protein
MDEKFIKIVADIIKVSPDKLTEDSTADTVPEWDSLNHWAVIEELENVYGIEFTIDEAIDFRNLGEIYETLQKKLKVKV